jgi:AraC family transcriptional regulator, transcriptional activator of pobA
MKSFIPEHRFDASSVNEFKKIPLAYYCQRHSAFPCHRHNFYELLLVEEGEGLHEVDFVQYPVQPDTLFFLHPNQVHLLQKATIQRGQVIIFTGLPLWPTYPYSLFQQYGNSPFIRADTPDWPMLMGGFALLSHELDRPQPDTSILRSALQTLLLLADRIYQQTAPPAVASRYDQQVFVDFRNLLETHFAAQADPAFYANELGIPERKLNHVTKVQAGRTAKQLLHDRLLLEAKRLLLFSTDDIKAIAFGLGFDDPFYFSRVFRKQEGISPEQYRQQRLNRPA